jgi:hypothetical protein
MDKLRLGVAQEIITPSVGGHLAGYNNSIFSTCVNDDLTVTAYYFEQGGQKALMISACVCSIRVWLSRHIRDMLAKAHNLPIDHITISAIHTHSGPATFGGYFEEWEGEIDREYCETIFIPQILKAAARAVASIPDGNRYSLRFGIRSSVGMKGRYSLDTYENQAERLYIVSDSYRSGGLFISALIDEARRKHCRVCVSYDPVNTDVPDAVLFEESGVGFVVCEGEGSEEIAGRINMKRFFSFPHATADSSRAKAEFRADRRLYDGLLGCACEKLAQAGEAHFALESIYGKCMDFEAESRYCNSLAQRVADLLEGKE